MDLRTLTRTEQLHGIGLMLLATVLFACMDLTVKHMTASYSVPQLAWARYMFHALLMVVFLGPRRRLGLLRSKRPWLQLLRSSLLLIITLLFFGSLKFIPIAEATTLAFANVPLVAVLSVVLLKESIDGKHWIAVAAGFIGVLIVLRPGMGIVHWGAFLALGMAVSYAFFQIVTRMLTSTEDAVTTLFYTALTGTVGTSLIAPFFWTPPSPADWLTMAAIGVMGGTGHFLLIKALEKAPASVISPFGYAPLIWVTIGGYVLFGDFPDTWTLAGAAVIIGSGMFLAARNRRQKNCPSRRRPPDPME